MQSRENKKCNISYDDDDDWIQAKTCSSNYSVHKRWLQSHHKVERNYRRTWRVEIRRDRCTKAWSKRHRNCRKTHTHTHTSEELFSHAHTHEASRPYCGPRLYLNLLFFPPPSLSLTGLYSILGSNGWMWVIGSRVLDDTLTSHA